MKRSYIGSSHNTVLLWYLYIRSYVDDTDDCLFVVFVRPGFPCYGSRIYMDCVGGVEGVCDIVSVAGSKQGVVVTDMAF